MMEFLILGPLEVTDDGRSLELGATKQQTLLAVLLLHADEIVSPTRLMTELWGEDPPSTAAKGIQGYVSSLRRIRAASTSTQRIAAPAMVAARGCAPPMPPSPAVRTVRPERSGEPKCVSPAAANVWNVPCRIPWVPM